MTGRKPPRGGMTAAEHEAWLKETGQYDAMLQRQVRQEQERQRFEAEYRLAEAPLVDELRAVGFAVQSAWDLVNTPGSYPDAIPILLAHLPRAYPGPVREGIARALAVPETKAAGWDLLTRLYCDEQEQRPKDGLAVAIAATADTDVIDEVITLARDPRNGSSRLLLLSAIARSRDARARAALVELESDPELTKEIRIILRRRERTRR